jgi:hypothetical protein
LKSGFFSVVAGALMQVLKAAPLVAPVDAAQVSRLPASAVEVRAASTATPKTTALMVHPPSIALLFSHFNSGGVARHRV